MGKNFHAICNKRASLFLYLDFSNEDFSHFGSFRHWKFHPIPWGSRPEGVIKAARGEVACVCFWRFQLNFFPPLITLRTSQGISNSTAFTLIWFIFFSSGSALATGTWPSALGTPGTRRTCFQSGVRGAPDSLSHPRRLASLCFASFA